jgi:hypothetical protein
LLTLFLTTSFYRYWYPEVKMCQILFKTLVAIALFATAYGGGGGKVRHCSCRPWLLFFSSCSRCLLCVNHVLAFIQCPSSLSERKLQQARRLPPVLSECAAALRFAL